MLIIMIMMSPSDIANNDTIQGQIDDDTYNYSILSYIDADTHYFKKQINIICENYRTYGIIF